MRKTRLRPRRQRRPAALFPSHRPLLRYQRKDETGDEHDLADARSRSGNSRVYQASGRLFHLGPTFRILGERVLRQRKIRYYPKLLCASGFDVRGLDEPEAFVSVVATDR